MSEKMTDATLEERLWYIAQELGQQTGDELRAHISAVTDERDEAKRIHAANVEAGIELAKDFNRIGGIGYEVDGVFTRSRALLMETVALRERVKVLEGMHDSAEHRVDVLESRLDAIRQRAWDERAVAEAAWAAYSERKPMRPDVTGGNSRDMALAVARYILSEDASEYTVNESRPAPDGVEPVTADADPLFPERMCGPHPVVGGWGVVCILPKGHEGGHSDGTDTDEVALHAESTTADAFATVRAGMGGDALPSAYHKAREGLSLLERRMGAQEAVLQRVLAAWMAHEVTGSPTLFYDVERALTNAPPVFTPVEVRKVAEEVRAAEMKDGTGTIDPLVELLARLALLRVP